MSHNRDSNDSSRLAPQSRNSPVGDYSTTKGSPYRPRVRPASPFTPRASRVTLQFLARSFSDSFAWGCQAPSGGASWFFPAGIGIALFSCASAGIHPPLHHLPECCSHVFISVFTIAIAYCCDKLCSRLSALSGVVVPLRMVRGIVNSETPLPLLCAILCHWLRRFRDMRCRGHACYAVSRVHYTCGLCLRGLEPVVER